MTRLRNFSLLLAAAASVPAFAQQQQQAPRRTVSLKEALQLAAKQGPDVAAARAQAQVTGASMNKAWTAWQPDIVATGTFGHTSAPAIIPAGVLGPLPITIVEENSKYATFQLSQPLLTPQGLFGPGIANSATEAAERGADEAREQVLLNVARTYLVLQGIEGLLIAARDAEKVALRREQDARARIAAGTDVEIGLLRAQTETAQARAQIAAFEGQQQSLLPLLEALTGESIAPQPLSGAPQDVGAPAQESAQPWEAAFSVKSARAATEAAQKSVRLDQFAWMPSVAGVARENYNSNGGFAGKNWTYDLIVNVSVPLYDRGLRYAQLHEDQARLARAQADLAAARARARSAWIGARANLAAADAVLQQSESQAQLATRAQAQVDASYRAGVATSLDVSDADQKKFAAQSAAAQSRALREIRRAELAAAAGLLYESVH